MNRRIAIHAACCAALFLASPWSLPAETELHAVAGLGYDWETAEGSPLRCLTGLGLGFGPLELTLAVDCGLPWEPAELLEASLGIADLDILRLDACGAAWLRDIEGIATEAGMRIGPRTEIGPRFLSLVAAGGWAVQSSYYPALGLWLGDSAPWAHLGIAWRPAPPVRLELSMGSDPTEAYWLRTVFQLEGSWEPSPGYRLAGLFALHYSDFFTLTSYLDGLEARILCRMPLGMRRP